MSLSFPLSPNIDDISTQNGRLYIWTGYSWDLVSNIINHAESHAADGSDPISLPLNITNSSNLYLWSSFR